MCSENSSCSGAGPSKITSAPMCMCDAASPAAGKRRRSSSSDPCDPADPCGESTATIPVREAPRDAAGGRRWCSASPWSRSWRIDDLPFGGDGADRRGRSKTARRDRRPVRLRRRLEAVARAGRDGAAPGRLADLAAARAAAARPAAARALRGGAGRPAQRRRHRPRARARLRRGRRALRHQGHPGLPRRQRRRVGHRGGHSSLRARSSARGTRSRSSAARRRGEPARHPGPAVRRSAACAAPRWRHRATATRAPWCCSTSSAIGDLRTPREGPRTGSCGTGCAAPRAPSGVGRDFPADAQGTIFDDHLPFLREGVPSIDLIDFDFPCWHRRCDDLSRVSERSLDVSGEAVLPLLA